ncbi:putative membrane protein [Fictibacillus halophilus]|uniref:Membrane protein n=1 Tax=Fictibacillus halophilus TaxID=1610490 RepID=A0ABV2LK65_9BACL|nr:MULTISPECIES: hypothetical protein [unclassified Fictibacillus]MBH0155647.1 hypothetical protein [Fictibacillus sp. 5RED26]MBH0161207.1 hypothetical protein [Fictibacillus sp. 26RED30]MBH0166111.1 hypothetical protein [Fictibacillus sp. 7GRE50]MBH0172840.1 hypothetical protein [Fictibacillus sp. 23RED33]
MYLIMILVSLLSLAGSFYFFVLSLLNMAPKILAIPGLFIAVLLTTLCYNYRSKLRRIG